MNIISAVWQIIVIVIIVFITVVIVYLGILLFKTLIKYLNHSDSREAKNKIKKSLGEAIKEHRSKCKMTQEFVAECLGVSRQAVSKWESGITEPSTSNLFALAKLFGITPEQLVKDVAGK
jgi:DNA-binding XRE family transcriptional regulator